MRIQSIVNTNDALEIAYLEEADIDIDAGVMKSSIVRVAHEALPQEFVDELETTAMQIIDLARRKLNRVADEFKVGSR